MNFFKKLRFFSFHVPRRTKRTLQYFSFHVPRRSSRTLQFLGQGSRSKLLGQVRVNRFIESGGGRGVKGYNSRVTKIGGGWRGGGDIIDPKREY